MNARLRIATMVLMGSLVCLLSPTGVFAQLYPPYIKIASSAPYGLETTNADKVVADNTNKLHLIFIDGTQLRYTSSTDFGWSWIPSTLVTSMQATSPALARDDAGNIGVAFVVPTSSASTGNLYYAFWTGLAWSQPVLISNMGYVRSPSMAGYGNRMHLTWSDGISIRYASVQTTVPAALPTSETVMSGTICSSADFRLPSIAVASPASGTQPVIRVGFYFQSPASCSSSAGVRVVERPATVGSGFWPAQEPNASRSGSIFMYEFVNATAPEVTSLTLSANRTSGYFFLAYCGRGNSSQTWQVPLARATLNPDSWQVIMPFGSAQSVPLILDVVPDQSTLDWFKLGSSQGTYGRTELKQGQWPAGMAAPPLIYSSGGIKSYYGRNPHVIDFEIENPATGEYRGINVVYSHRPSGSSIEEIRTDPFSYH